MKFKLSIEMLTTFQIFLMVFTMSLSSYSQEFIDGSKSKIKKSLEKYTTKTKLHTIITETDTTISFLLRDSTVQNLDQFFYFDSKGKCDKELTVLTCDSCYKKLLTGVLKNKNYRWVKIDDVTYYTRFPYRLILKTKIDTKFAYEIRRKDIEGYEYRRQIRAALSK